MEKNNIFKIILLGIITMVLSFSVTALQAEILDTSPSPAVAGEYIDITLRLTNPNDADDITKELYFGIEENSNLLVSGENPKLIGSLGKGQSISRTFRVYINENLPQGTIEITSFVNISGKIITFDDELFIEEVDSKPELLIGAITTTPKELLPDTKDNQLIVTVLNLGDKDADLVTAEIITDEELVKPSYSYSLKNSAASINSGSEKDLTFTIDLEEGAKKQISSTLKITYRVEKNGGRTYETKTDMIPFTIDLIDAPYLQISEVKQEKPFSAGTTENDIILAITNTGNAEAEEVRVRLIPDISYPFSFEQLTEYVASEIKPGETVNVAFTTEVFSNGVDKEYSITTRLESLVGETRYSQDDVVTVSVISAEKISITQIALWIVAFIVIISIIFGVLSRRNK